MSIADQEENIIQFYRDVATQAAQANAKEKAEPNAKAMTKAMDMFNGRDVVQHFHRLKQQRLLCSITGIYWPRASSCGTDHRLDSAWFGAGAAIKQRGLEQALRMVS